MTAVLEDTISTVQLATELDVSHQTVLRWATTWYPPPGRGARIRLTREDVLVARAWRHIEIDNSNYPATRRMRPAAEAAIREDPQRWLLISDRAVTTHVSASEAAWAWLAFGCPAAQVWSTSRRHRW